MSRIFPAVLFAFVLAACGKDVVVTGTDGGPVELTVSVRGDAPVLSKAVGVESDSPESESKVSSLQVFVFNGNPLDGYGRSEGSLSATVNCSAGVRDVWAVVNGPDLSAVRSKAELLSSVCPLSARLDHFVMAGSVSREIAVGGSVTVDVARLASRVVLGGVRNALDNEVLAADFRIEEIYLTNVAADVDVARSEQYAVRGWYNRGGMEEGAPDAVVRDAVGRVLAKGESYAVKHYFYSMPNGFDPALGGPWTPRRARLVVRATVCGVTEYYPVELPVLESNKTYEVTLLTLTRPGNPDDGIPPQGTDTDGDGVPDVFGDDEERPITGGVATFTVNVLPWELVLVGDAEGNVVL